MKVDFQVLTPMGTEWRFKLIMTIKAYLKLVEIQTKVASFFPFVVGTLYTLWRYKSFSGINMLLMFVSLICFDMATTAINNYIDFSTAKVKHGFGYNEHNAMTSYGISPKTALTVIFSLLILAAVSGFLLFLRTDIIVLLLGGLSFAAGVLYTFGPVPISRTPLGELLSGGLMGFVIPFLACYIHIYDSAVYSVSLNMSVFAVEIQWLELVSIALVSSPLVCGIANIMLANNLCDEKEDFQNRRYTLVVHIGQRLGRMLFAALTAGAYVGIVLAVIVGAFPPTMLLALITAVPVAKNTRAFCTKPDKATTFVLAVKNFVLIGASCGVILAASVIWKYFTIN